MISLVLLLRWVCGFKEPGGRREVAAAVEETGSREEEPGNGVCDPLTAQEDPLSFEDIESIVEFIRSRTDVCPSIGVICGSGLGGLAEDLDKDRPKVVISYREIPRFPRCFVKGHAGNLVFGFIAGQPVVCMQGRFHFYEGHPPWKITMPVRVMKLLGVSTMIVTNAAGGLNAKFKMGDIMIVKDHINLAGMAGANPLIGRNEDRFGPRFPPMSSAYDPELRQATLEAARELNLHREEHSIIQEGVYVHLSGPSYETPAESRLLQMLGADAVGMSTAPEVVVAKHCDIRVLGLSLITNMVILDQDSTQTPPCHTEVMDTANKRAKDMQLLVKTVIKKLSPAANGTSS